MSTSRREFLAGLAGAGALAAVPHAARAAASTCPFRLSVINDEISADFDHACSVAANDFGLSWIEIRSMWGKNVTDLNADEVDRSRQILEKYKLRVTDIASPLFKVHWPGAPHFEGGSAPRPVPRRFRFQTAGRGSRALHRSLQGVPDRSHPLLRLLAA